jgi:7-cyano-7-deazaguanine reductase
MQFEKLGKQTSGPSAELETFDAPRGVTSVLFETKEVTAFCPVTMQPDLYTVIMEYAPARKCLETKSLKLYLWTFRDKGIFAEELADRIAHDLNTALAPFWVRVTVVQQIRGGIQTTAQAEYGHDDE